MARTFAWRSALLAAAVAAGCSSEQITTPGNCPALCPSSRVQLADTLLAAPDTADTSARGFVTIRDAAFLLLSSLDSLKSVALIRFTAMPTKWALRAGDTTSIVAAMPPDSILLGLHVTQRDTSVKKLSLVLYRLPAQFDTTMSYAQAQQRFADSLVVDTAAIPDSLISAAVSFRMPIAFVAPPADSNVISLGVKVIGPPTALGLASSNPSLSYFVHGTSPNDTLKRTLTVEPSFAIFVQSPDPSQTVPGILSVVGLPSARATFHLALPKVVVDSIAIVRATLILNTTRRIVGFARDSFYVEARPLLRDFGLKSVLFPDSSISGYTRVHEGQSGTVELDIARILRLWGTTVGDTLPHVLVLRVFGEGSVIGQVDFKGRSAASGGPQLRVTYVKKYAFGVP
jgi:hypothetical protein